MAKEKQCSRCGKKVRKDNSKGVCSQPCVGTAGAAPIAASRGNGHSNGRGHVGVANGGGTLTVSAQGLDVLWRLLPLEEKAKAISAVLGA